MDDRAWARSTRALLEELREEELRVDKTSAPRRHAPSVMLRRAESANLYTVLGVPEHADEELIRKSYFEQVALYHPDRVASETLGLSEEQQRRILGALTHAYDTLRRGRTRKPYDEYLKSRSATLGARTSLEPGAGDEPELESTVYSVVQAGQPSTKPPVAPTRPASPQGRERQAVRASQEESPSVPVRARSLRARVLGSRPALSKSESFKKSAKQPRPQTLPGSVPAGSIPPQSDVSGIPIAQVGGSRFRKLLDGAVAEENWASAVNLARLALEVEPGSAELQRMLGELLAKADRMLADKFVAQGKYEEEVRNYGRAARSYERAANGKGSAELYAKAARCLLAEGTDNRRAVEVARKAMLLEQESADYRVLLARAYIAAGMHQSALGEARRALVYDPKNPDAKTLVRELK